MTWFDVLTASITGYSICAGVLALGFWLAQLIKRKPRLRVVPSAGPGRNPLESAESSLDTALDGLAKLTEDPAKFQKFFGAVDKLVSGMPATKASNAVILGAPGEDAPRALASGEIGVMCTRQGAAGLVNLLHEAAAEVELERPQLAVRLRRLRDVVLRGTSEFSQVQAQRGPGPVSGLEDSPHVN